MKYRRTKLSPYIFVCMYVCSYASTSYTMALGSTQPLKEYQEYFLEVKVAGA